uniref:Uncharacterized protein n=1 Tax=Salix viminalis TaxID=40686 RepID=A0A6N2L759_SALVM
MDSTKRKTARVAWKRALQMKRKESPSCNINCIPLLAVYNGMMDRLYHLVNYCMFLLVMILVKNDEQNLLKLKALLHQPFSVSIESSARDFKFYQRGKNIEYSFTSGGSNT